MNLLSLKWVKKFDQLDMRSRLLIVIGVSVLMYFFWKTLIHQSIDNYKKSLIDQSEQLQESIKDMKDQISSAEDLIKQNPQLVLQKQVEEAKNKSVLLDKEIYKRTSSMVSPKDMNKIVATLIGQSKGLSLLKIDSLDKKAFSELKNSTSDSEKTKLNIFEHGISVEMMGGYFETMNFLRNLERNHLNVVWDELSYEVLEYPKAKIKLVMHTLSLDEGWIGV